MFYSFGADWGKREGSSMILTHVNVLVVPSMAISRLAPYEMT